MLALPYWGAVMTPYWDQDARGCLIGLTNSHGTAHIYRALLEGIALEQSVVTKMILAATGGTLDELIAIGGGAASSLWLQILADTCGTPVKRSGTIEASSLGAAMCAAAEAMHGAVTSETEPCAARQSRYTELRQIYQEVYPQLRQIFGKLASFGRSDSPIESQS